MHGSRSIAWVIFVLAALLAPAVQAAGTDLGPEARALLAKGKPCLCGPFAGLRFGMTRKEVRRLKPALLLRGRSRAETRRGKPFDLEVTFAFGRDADSERLVTAVAYLERSAGLQLVTAKWGKPRTNQGPIRMWYFWSDPRAGIRAALMRDMETAHWRLELTPLYPFAQLFDRRSKDGLLALVAALGKRPTALARAAGWRYSCRDDKEHCRIWYGPSNYSSSGHAARLTLTKGIVTQVELTLWFNYRQSDRMRIVNGLTSRIGAFGLGISRYGQWSRTPGRSDTWLLRRNPSVAVYEYTKQRAFKITITPKVPSELRSIR